MTSPGARDCGCSCFVALRTPTLRLLVPDIKVQCMVLFQGRSVRRAEPPGFGSHYLLHRRDGDPLGQVPKTYIYFSPKWYSTCLGKSLEWVTCLD